MKKVMTILAAVFAIALTASAYEVTVTTNSTVVVPGYRIGDGEVWTNGLVVANGDYIVNTNLSLVYFVIAGGTSTNLPTHTVGTATGTDGVETLYLTRRYKNAQRSNAIIFLFDTTDTVYYTHNGQAATVGDSILDASRPARSFPGEQGDVEAITASGTAVVNVEIKRGNR
jgi:hypothetical protein